MQPSNELIASLDDIGDLFDSDKRENAISPNVAFQTIMQNRYGMSRDEAEDKLREFEDLFAF